MGDADFFDSGVTGPCAYFSDAVLVGAHRVARLLHGRKIFRGISVVSGSVCCFYLVVFHRFLVFTAM